jgi:hypothetical protein
MLWGYSSSWVSLNLVHGFIICNMCTCTYTYRYKTWRKSHSVFQKNMPTMWCRLETLINVIWKHVNAGSTMPCCALGWIFSFVSVIALHVNDLYSSNNNKFYGVIWGTLYCQTSWYSILPQKMFEGKLKLAVKSLARAPSRRHSLKYKLYRYHYHLYNSFDKL